MKERSQLMFFETEDLETIYWNREGLLAESFSFPLLSSAFQ